MIDYEAVQLALRNRLITVSGLWAGAWQNVDYTPVTGTPYVEEAFSPSTNTARGFPIRNALLDVTGLYVVRLYGLEHVDTKPINDLATAIVAKFASGTLLTLGNGDKVRIRGDGTGPTPSEPIPNGLGRCVAVVTIPWRVRTRNAIAA